MGMRDRTPTSPEEFDGYKTRFSNWGRWGADDQLGTLNHITPEVRRAAIQSVQHGRSVSCSNPIPTVEVQPNLMRNAHPAEHPMRPIPPGYVDALNIWFHGMVDTHIDATSHYFPDGLMYNGRPGSLVNDAGAASNSVDSWRDGIITRGVLYDIARMRGQAHIQWGEGVQGWDLEDFAKQHGITPRAGDAVLIRSGSDPFWATNPDITDVHNTPGVAPSALEFLHDTGASLLAWDLTEDAGPTDTTFPHPVHRIALVYMGMPLVDASNFERLGEACAELGRYEFLYTIAPLVLVGGTGSPVNPIATL